MYIHEWKILIDRPAGKNGPGGRVWKFGWIFWPSRSAVDFFLAPQLPHHPVNLTRQIPDRWSSPETDKERVIHTSLLKLSRTLPCRRVRIFPRGGAQKLFVSLLKQRRNEMAPLNEKGLAGTPTFCQRVVFRMILVGSIFSQLCWGPETQRMREVLEDRGGKNLGS